MEPNTESTNFSKSFTLPNQDPEESYFLIYEAEMEIILILLSFGCNCKKAKNYLTNTGQKIRFPFYKVLMFVTFFVLGWNKNRT